MNRASVYIQISTFQKDNFNKLIIILRLPLNSNLPGVQRVSWLCYWLVVYFEKYLKAVRIHVKKIDKKNYNASSPCNIPSCLPSEQAECDPWIYSQELWPTAPLRPRDSYKLSHWSSLSATLQASLRPSSTKCHLTGLSAALVHLMPPCRPLCGPRPLSATLQASLLPSSTKCHLAGLSAALVH